ncbi:MAG: cytochrome P450 [Pseudomonadota bacterium]
MLKILQTQDFMRDPTQVLARFRAEGPLVSAKIPILGKVWLTTTQAATAHVLKNSSKFTTRKRDGMVVGMSWWMPRILTILSANMLSADEPEHTRLRSIVDKAFHRGAVINLQPRIESIANDLSAKLDLTNEPADLLTGFARPFPLAVICELLGLPKEDHANFMRWASGITTVRGIPSFFVGIYRLRPLVKYIENRIAKVQQGKAQEPGLIQSLVALRDEGDGLSDDELVAMIFLLLLAGHETTTHLISNSMLAFFQNPDQLALLKKEPGMIDLAVEECLRFTSPVQTAKPRYVQNDCMIEGMPVRAGELVLPFLAAANFDPTMFEAAETFDISRKPNRHIEFGTGIHFCLGHQLARHELKIALQTLLDDYQDLQLAVPESDVEWHSRFGLRSLKTLWVRG